MSRVVLPVAVSMALTVAGCAVGGSSLSSGLASNPLVGQKSATLNTDNRGGLGGDPQSSRKPASNVKLARADDKAPAGQFEKAPAGALADRNYGATKLDTDQAREVINTYRQSKGLKPLKLNAALTEAAKAHSLDLAKWDRISHYGSDGSNPWDRVKRTGYNAKVAAENVGTGQASIVEVMKGWQESAGHNKNLLLPDVEHMGIALVQDPKTEFKTFWTLVIGSSG
jgi:uncharacterized protein YkwD